ncbi:glycosyltransferase involved in cell wall biosynthesis [Arcticibacter tournemirensis]|uniref:Glycosyltransferase n=1 Tax=Arcticibacter tournemirensis TaxID=699437 RepID=A0A5M9HCF7_9SPHI|nr:glycosyltransferase family 2 protein [Arcticibacter tournemirensis]KAA8484636.1 glycosyltransferase [Arcticibacter tournemirensis]TQM47075.1 glycosyltransferase involved in cell wall biosynthesis [Arcticibacter tournemirensis]
MSATPLISVILVTYNVEKLLQNCLNSIFRQEYPSLETIVIDGASTDGTIDILKANSSRIKFWKSEKDSGIYDAMNKALDHISGEWVYFIGADDELTPDFSALAYELKDASAIYYGSVLKDGKKYLGQLSPYHHAKTGINHQAMFYPVSVFRKYKFDTTYPISADHILNMWCWKDKDFRFEFRDYIIAIFNHTGVSSLKKDLLFEKRKANLILKNYGVAIWLRFLFKKLKARLSSS